LLLASRAAGHRIAEHPCRNDTKHSRGSHLLEETQRIHVVQDALGHKNVASTMIYAQVSNRDRREAVALNRSKYRAAEAAVTVLISLSYSASRANFS